MHACFRIRQRTWWAAAAALCGRAGIRRAMPRREARFRGGGVDEEPVSDAASDISSLPRSVNGVNRAASLRSGASPCGIETAMDTSSSCWVGYMHSS